MMTKTLRIVVLLALTLQFSGCRLGFLASKKQLVSIQKDSSIQILVNDSLPLLKNGKYIFKRNNTSVQIKLQKEGFKDEYKVIMPYKKNGLYYATLATNTIIVGTVSTVGFSIFGLFFSDLSDASPESILTKNIALGSLFGIGSGLLIGNDYRLRSFEKKINLNPVMTQKIIRDSTMKELYLNKVAFDVSKLKFQRSYLSVKKYYAGKKPTFTQWDSNKGLNIDNSIFSDEINKVLKKNGFIDTSGLVLKGSYKENLFLNSTITDFKVLHVESTSVPGLTKLIINSKWSVLDIYKNTIYSDTIELQSGEFVMENGEEEACYKNMINDALESGLYKLMSTQKFKETIKVPTRNEVENLISISINRPTKAVTSLQEAVEATATIKTKSGHGSGFLISEDGYLITNYHVIADSAKLEVILNNGTKYNARIIQYNKDADLAILKIEKTGLLPFQLPENESLSLGKEIYVIGTPSAEDLSQTLSRGIISSIRKQSDGSKLIQTDASVNSGNSGGPLVDKMGNLLGVVNANLIGIGVEGISFAIPASKMIPALKLSYK
jgi:hypothetical protein